MAQATYPVPTWATP